MRKPLSVLAVVVAMLTSVATATLAAPGGSQATTDTTSALVELVGDPLATSPKTHPAQGKKIDFSSTTVKSERARLSAIRNDFKLWLRKNAPKAKVTSELDIALHAVGVALNGTTLATLRSAPMVKSAEFQALYAPLAHEDPGPAPGAGQRGLDAGRWRRQCRRRGQAGHHRQRHRPDPPLLRRHGVPRPAADR